jgi:hypothetical protein
MILATLEVMPLMIVVKRLAEEVATFVLITLKVVVAKIPFVVLLKVIVLLVVELVSKLVVEAGIKLASEVVAITPLIVVVSNPVEVENMALELLMILAVVVEITPLTLVVQV